MKKRVNILVLGLDESTERAAWGSFRTDTMILVSCDFDKKTVDMISIPRDSYVKIGQAMGKINSAFPKGGGAKRNGYTVAMRTVSNLLGGVPIDFYVGFDMNFVKDVVNAMGGVDYDVDVDVKMNGRTLSPGFQHLDGQQVLDYCRQRKGSSDIARVDRQQRMLMAIFSQLKSTKQIFHIPEIYTAVQNNMDTNLTFARICSLALLAARMDEGDLQRHMVEGEFLDMQNTSYWGVSTTRLKALVKKVFGINITPDPDIDVKAIKQELERLQKGITAAIKEAQGSIKLAEELLNSGKLSDTEAKELQRALDGLKAACEEADAVELIRAAHVALNELLSRYGVLQPSASTEPETSAQPTPTDGGDIEELPPDDEPKPETTD